MQVDRTPDEGPKLEYLKELSRGPFGVVSLARVLNGPDLGRLVTTRRLSLERLEIASVERVLSAVRQYSQLSHPSLVKGIHVRRTATELVLVEEHVIGASLGKLQQLAFERQHSVPTGVGVKLIIDVLRAALAVRHRCVTQNLPIPARLIFPDSVVIASFGEALLSGVGVTSELYRNRCVREHPELMDVLDPFAPVDVNCAEERFEVFAVGALLWKLLLIRGLFNNFGNQQTLNLVLHSNVLSIEYNERLNLCVPKPIATVVRRATQRNPKLRYQTLQEMLGALEGNSRSLLGTDAEVRAWLGKVARDLFSDLQHDSGIRRVPSALSVSSSADTCMVEHIDTVLPGHRITVGDTVVPSQPPLCRDSPRPALLPGAGPESAPAMAMRSNSVAPDSPKRSVVRAYVIGALIGVGLALGLSRAMTQIEAGAEVGHSMGVQPLGSGEKHLLSPNAVALAPPSAAVGSDAGLPRANSPEEPRVRLPTQGKSSSRTKRDVKVFARAGDAAPRINASPAAATATPSAVPNAPSNANRWGI